MKLIDLSDLSTKRLNALAEAGIESVGDLLNFFPRRYLDRTTVSPIGQLTGRGEEVTVIGRIKNIQEAGYGRKKRLEVILQDETGSLKGVWFKGVKYFRKHSKKMRLLLFMGRQNDMAVQFPLLIPMLTKSETPVIYRILLA